MDSGSLIYTSPSFTINSTNDDIADIADRVVQQLRIENGFENDYDFTFSDDDNNPTQTPQGKQIQQDEQEEFEFPVISRDSNSNSNSNSSSVSVSLLTDEHQISLQYPLFDQSLLSQTDLIAKTSDVADNSPVTEPELKPVTSPRKSLKKLFSEDYDAPSTSSSSETDDLDGVTPGTYCEWKPKTERERELPRGKHKKSNSVSINNESKRWKVRDLLKRSYSDDNYSTGKDSPVVVFLPPLSPKQKTNGEKVNKSEKTGTANKMERNIPAATKTERNIPAATKMERNVPAATKTERNIPAATKTERNIPAYRTKIGNIRIPPYLPYRQGQVAAFGNFTTGSSTNMNMYRY